MRGPWDRKGGTGGTLAFLRDHAVSEIYAIF